MKFNYFKRTIILTDLKLKQFYQRMVVVLSLLLYTNLWVVQVTSPYLIEVLITLLSQPLLEYQLLPVHQKELHALLTPIKVHQKRIHQLSHHINVFGRALVPCKQESPRTTWILSLDQPKISELKIFTYLETG